MTFPSLVFLLLRERLHFTRADMLDDPFEGVLPVPNVEDSRKLEQAWALAAQKRPIPPPKHHFMREHFDRTRRSTAVNCWHKNRHESAAMWGLYLKSEEGIAVQSTFERLTRSFLNDTALWVIVSEVAYIDYDKKRILEDHHLQPLIHKRISFNHEHEVRALVQRADIDENGVQRAELDPFELTHVAGKPLPKCGVDVAVDVSTLIEKVYVAPKTATWFFRLVSDTVRRFGYTFPVKQSQLGKDPVW